jgi:acetoacetyl-CoA synthetase
MASMSEEASMRNEIVWEPDPGRATRIDEFTGWLAEHRRLRFSGYDELWAWSIDDVEAFWQAIADWAPLRWHNAPRRALADGDRAMPGARWFPGGTLNYAEHALAHGVVDPAGVAVVERSQTRGRHEVAWDELADAVARCRVGLRRLGVVPGDRVAAFAPHTTETLIGFLATASLGATWASCPPEFGIRSVVDRLAQIAPKVLLAVDGYRYGTRAIDRRNERTSIQARLPHPCHLVPIRYLGTGEDGWHELLADHEPLAFEAVPADHPLYVLFSSGTTGLPKPIMHGHGGITIEHLKVLALHNDLSPGDRFSWFTTTGWMMWNYLVSGLLVGATVVLVDGDPGHPDLSALWQMAAEEQLHVLGLSAPFIMSCRKAGLRPGEAFDLSALRSVGSTGSPLPPDGFRWVRDAVGAHVQPASVSGGTDVCTGFVGGVPTIPVRAGEITRPLLGCDVRAIDSSGTECPPGVTGELVINAPLPSMPVGFWGDPDGERLRRAYFGDHPGRWTHGDWITIFDDRSCVISGRSDATLNRGGVRLGTSDFYAVVEELPEVLDSLVVHLDRPGDPMGELVLFVALADGVELDEALRQNIAAALRRELSPRHVPDRIEAVPVIPRTMSGKKLEVPVKRLLEGASLEAVASKGSLADPTSLDHFVGPTDGAA